jgi:tetratricopeptide (TPR) repeat protein
VLESIVSDENKKLPMIQNLKGQCQMKLGNLDKAIDHFEMCLVIDPKFKVAHNNLGNIYLQQNDYSKSKIYFEKSKKSNP